MLYSCKVLYSCMKPWLKVEDGVVGDRFTLRLMQELLVSTLKNLKEEPHKLKKGPQITSYKLCYSTN